MLFHRWVYRRFFVADGNFKADHVQQKNVSDIWLSEGAGMFARRSEYQEFLRTAVEHLTVGDLHACQPSAIDVWCCGSIVPLPWVDGAIMLVPLLLCRPNMSLKAHTYPTESTM